MPQQLVVVVQALAFKTLCKMVWLFHTLLHEKSQKAAFLAAFLISPTTQFVVLTIH